MSSSSTEKSSSEPGVAFSNPIYGEMDCKTKIPVPKPRLRHAKRFESLCEDIYENVPNSNSKDRDREECHRNASKSLFEPMRINEIVDQMKSLVNSFQDDVFVKGAQKDSVDNDTANSECVGDDKNGDGGNEHSIESNYSPTHESMQNNANNESDSGRCSMRTFPISSTSGSDSTSSVESLANPIRKTSFSSVIEEIVEEKESEPELPPRKSPQIDLPTKVNFNVSNGKLDMKHLHEEAISIQRSGFLWKTGPNFKCFKYRWCILCRNSRSLCDANFSYYFNRNSMSVSLSGKVMLSEIEFVSVVDTIPNKTRLPKVEKCKDSGENLSLAFFEIGTKCKQGRIYLLAARSSNDRQHWMHAFIQSLTLHSFGNKELSHFGFVQAKFTITAKWERCFAILTKDRYLYVFEMVNSDCKVYHLFNLRKTIRISTLNDNVDGEMEEFSLTQNGGYVIYLQCEIQTHLTSWYQSVMKHWQAYSTADKTYSLLEQYLTRENVPIAIDKCLKFLDTFHKKGSVTLFSKDMPTSSRHNLDPIVIKKLPQRSGGSRSQSLKNRQTKPEVEDVSEMLLLNEMCTNAWNVHLLPQKYSANTISLILLQYLRSMSECLFTEQLLTYWMQVADNVDIEHSERSELLKKLLQLLPQVNYATLRRIIIFLSNFPNYKHNLPTNLCKAMVFSKGHLKPTIIKLSSAECLITSIIKDYLWLFEVTKEELEKEIRIQRVVHLINNKNNSALDKQKLLCAARFRANRKLMSPERKYGPDINVDNKQVNSLIIAIKVCLGPNKPSTVNVHLSKDTTADDVVNMIQQKINISEALGAYSLFEVLCYKRLERPIGGEEYVLPIVLCWSNWPSHWSADACLLFKQVKQFFCSTQKIRQTSVDSSNYSPMLMSVIRYCSQSDTRLIKKVLAELSNAQLLLYCKESHQLITQHNVEDIVWYVGAESGAIFNYSPTKCVPSLGGDDGVINTEYHTNKESNHPSTTSSASIFSNSSASELRKGSNGDNQMPALTFIDKDLIKISQCKERINFGQTLLFNSWNELNQWIKGLYESVNQH